MVDFCPPLTKSCKMRPKKPRTTKTTPTPQILITKFAKGLTIDSPRLSTTRMIKWDIQGPCSTCKSRKINFGQRIKPGGILIKSKRLRKPVFVAFDKGKEEPFRHGDFIKIRTRYDTFIIPMVFEDPRKVSIPGFTGTIIGKQGEEEKIDPEEILRQIEEAMREEVPS